MKTSLHAQGRPGLPSACALLAIPGLTHPVQDFFLDDVLERTGVQIGRSSK